MTDSQIREQGLRALVTALGEVDAERFVALLQRERFDYTQWQRDLWNDKSVEQISREAAEQRRRRTGTERP